jgi:iron complex transport system ATP-binding protein
VIEAEDVSVEFGRHRALDGVSLVAERGEFLALVGPNGAGKTTLLRTVNGIVDPTGGSVRVGGERVSGLSAKALARRVATVPQTTSLGFDFDVRAIVEMGRTPHRSRWSGERERDREAIARALSRTRTEGLADRPVGELSGGERQRVLLARALAQETPALLLDEPTASLDINHQVTTLSLVRELVGEGRVAVAAIHDLDLAARFCDRMALLTDGGLVAVGTPEEVLTPDRLHRAYGIRASVRENPVTGTPSVTALDGETEDERPPLAADD